MFEVAYPNDDMSYESLQQLCILHRCIAEDEVSLGNDEAIIRKHLTRAVELAAKSANVKAHSLAHPLVTSMNKVFGLLIFLGALTAMYQDKLQGIGQVILR